MDWANTKYRKRTNSRRQLEKLEKQELNDKNKKFWDEIIKDNKNLISKNCASNYIELNRIVMEKMAEPPNLSEESNQQVSHIYRLNRTARYKFGLKNVMVRTNTYYLLAQGIPTSYC